MICVIVPCLCNDISITQITPEIPQTSLHKHGTITQNPDDIPQTSLYKHGQ
jgi:hypothetical protein